ncbi:MAG: type I restriction enzyme HsdR N-terminal domain-containing protein, partial [Fibromonadaceae bacterium]|nr:type I restriction enzyme HsdR N-terminal domain-containing protein [Fibromonadaceae bacterium]
MTTSNPTIFSDLDFGEIESKGFNEADVRAVIIDPLLKELGFSHENIMREKALKSPFLKIGSKKRAVNLIPDYALKVENSFAWVLDAKASNQKIINSDHVEQVYSYATHPEIRSNYFALCNGLEFVCFRTTDTEKPVLYFHVSEIGKHWQTLQNLLSPNSFQIGKILVPENPDQPQKADFDYAKRPLLKEIPVKKQAVKRHFGVHGYFTRQAWNVVAEYIKNFSKPGDVVLDPFGGSGVTAIEAFMNGRRAISIDINPMAVFIVQSLLAPVKFSEFANAFDEVKNEYLKHEPKTKEEIEKALKKYKGCKALPLPKGSDVPTADLLFNKEQTAQLALLKSIILKQKDENIRNSLLLCFSGLVTKYNLTVHSNEDLSKDKKAVGGPNCSAFQYYRYRIAPRNTKIDLIKYFENSRYKKIRDAKQEMSYFINENTINNAQVIKGTATYIPFLNNESVDYIYTDPPYGKKIPYLDLSTMWNAWLDLDVSEEDYKLEAIEGGEHNKTKEDYNSLIAKSIQEMYRVLKFDRWLSFVFAHKDPEFWHLIIDTCEKCGFEYIG